MTHSRTFRLRRQRCEWALPRAIAAVGVESSSRTSRRVNRAAFPSVRPCFGLSKTPGVLACLARQNRIAAVNASPDFDCIHRRWENENAASNLSIGDGVLRRMRCLCCGFWFFSFDFGGYLFLLFGGFPSRIFALFFSAQFQLFFGDSLRFDFLRCSHIRR